MVTASDKLRELARALGVSTSYHGWDGQERRTSDETLREVITALGFPCADEQQLTDALDHVPDLPWRSVVPPTTVVEQGRRSTFWVHVPHGAEVEVWVRTEDGDRVPAEQVDVWVAPRRVDGVLVGRATFAVPDLPLGWHTLEARTADGTEHGTLVVTPGRLRTADRLLARRRWGVAAQLYSVRSARSWGVGDLADLADLAALTARAGSPSAPGADFVLVNPLHAAEPTPPRGPSPYWPGSRRFVDPLYLCVPLIREAVFLPAEDRQRLEEASAGFAAGNRSDERIDRDPAYAAKLDLLERIHRVPRSPARQAAFDRFRRERGQALEDFALWCALTERFGGPGPAWGPLQAGPHVPAADDARLEHRDRIDFWCWVQWQCDEQLAETQQAARTAGMDLGVMHDLAVGVQRDGADGWTLGDSLVRGMSVGAPPDDFNQSGQSWGQPPWHPRVLAERGYAPYRDMVRAVLRHAGGLRLDHVLGLFRTWWIPEGRSPAEGAYVSYDHEALLGILVLEAQRADAVLVGEDLGVFERWVQDYLAERGVAGTSILWFEWDGDRPRPPEDYRKLCLSSVTTHDLPPTAGYLAGDHLTLRSDLGLLPRGLEAERADFARQRDAVLAALRERGLVGEDPSEADVVVALHRYLAAAPSALHCVSLADAVGERRSQNQPGTTDEYPNWRIPLADAHGDGVLLEDLPAMERFTSLVEAVATALARRE